METFAQRLRKLRESANIGQGSLAKLVGIGEGLIISYEAEYSEPDTAVLQRLADIFGVSAEYMAMLSDDPCICEDELVQEVYVTSESDLADGVKISGVIGVAYVAKMQLNGASAFALLMKDDSMKKAINKNDIVIFRRQSAAENGDIVAVSVGGGDPIIRKYEKIGRLVTLSAENSFYRPIKVDTDKEGVTIFGKAIERRTIL